MKPGDHPDFFRMAAPPGGSRESRIFLDREGRLFHEGTRVEHAGLERSMRSWITAHPETGRPILSNGYDWCYFSFAEAPMFVASLGPERSDGVDLRLFDESTEPLDPATLSIGADGGVFTRVRGGSLLAKFTRHAQHQLAPFLICDAPPTVRMGGRDWVLPELGENR